MVRKMAIIDHKGKRLPLNKPFHLKILHTILYKYDSNYICKVLFEQYKIFIGSLS